MVRLPINIARFVDFWGENGDVGPIYYSNDVRCMLVLVLVKFLRVHQLLPKRLGPMNVFSCMLVEVVCHILDTS